MNKTLVKGSLSAGEGYLNYDLPPNHSSYHITDDDNNRICTYDRWRHRPYAYPGPVRDANDHTHYVEQGSWRPDLASPNRCDTRVNGPCNRFWLQSGGKMNLVSDYFTECRARESYLHYCILYKSKLDQCTVSNSHIHFPESYDVTDCVFTDCIITTAPDCEPIYIEPEYLTNCTLRGNFQAHDPGPSDLQCTAKNQANTQLFPYEVHNNIVLKECVVDCLRRFIWRCRIRKLEYLVKVANLNARYTPPDSPGMNIKKNAIMSLEAELEDLKEEAGSLSAKKMGKKPMYTSEMYGEEDQLSLPRRRMEWSVFSKAGRSVTPKRRRTERNYVVID